MANYHQVCENPGVQPLDDGVNNAQNNRLDHAFAAPWARLLLPPVYQDEVYDPALHRTGLGTCSICRDVTNNCVMVSRQQGLPYCGHLICFTCVQTIRVSGGQACPLCRRPISQVFIINQN